ncbi:MAG: D-alanyl-D-alanine carboxypeptidase family protein [Oligosphaeraceae bacterium]
MIIAIVTLVHGLVCLKLLKSGREPSPTPVATAPTAPVTAPAAPPPPTTPGPAPAPAQPSAPVASPAPQPPAAPLEPPDSRARAAARAAADARPLVPRNPSYGPFVDDPGNLPPKLEQQLERGCRSGILVDLGSRRILWQKDARTAYAIASMSKIMTAYELLCELSEPDSKHTLETVVQVPRKMFRKFSDCHIYMDPRESFTLDELLKCMMIHSANDCAFLIGEFMAGSEEAFVKRMNQRAAAMGLRSFSFCNTNGLPDRKNHRANRGSALDMAYLAEYVMDVPAIMKWAGTKLAHIREKEPGRRFDLANKNRLLDNPRCPGVNGLKTGYIDESKFCITVTAERKGRRMICVVMGADKAKSRDALVTDLLAWGYAIE